MDFIKTTALALVLALGAPVGYAASDGEDEDNGFGQFNAPVMFPNGRNEMLAAQVRGIMEETIPGRVRAEKIRQMLRDENYTLQPSYSEISELVRRQDVDGVLRAFGLEMPVEEPFNVRNGVDGHALFAAPALPQGHHMFELVVQNADKIVALFNTFEGLEGVSAEELPDILATAGQAFQERVRAQIQAEVDANDKTRLGQLMGLQNQLRRAQEDMARVEREKEELQQRVTKAEEYKTAVEGQISEVEGMLHQSRAAQEENQADLAEKENAIRTLEARINTLNAQLAAQSQSAHAEAEGHAHDGQTVARLNQEKRALEAEKETLQAAKTQLEEDANKAKERAAHLEGEKFRLQGELEMVQKALQEKTLEAEGRSKALDEVMDEKGDLETKLEAARKGLEEKEQELLKAANEKEEVKAVLRTVNEESTSLKGEIKDLLQQIQILNKTPATEGTAYQVISEFLKENTDLLRKKVPQKGFNKHDSDKLKELLANLSPLFGGGEGAAAAALPASPQTESSEGSDAGEAK